MRGRIGTLATAATLVLATSSLGLAATAGTADAAATPIVIGSCATSVQGEPGQPVSLSPGAVVQPITNVLNAIPLLGPPLAQPFQKAFTALPPIPIGALPTGSGYISGGTIASQVVAQLKNIPLLGPVIGLLVGGVQQALTAGCGVAVQGVNTAVAPIQTGTSQLPGNGGGSTGGTGGGGGTTGGGSTGGTGGTGGGSTGGGTTTGGSGGGGSVNFPTSGGVTNGGVQLYQFNGSGSYDYGRVPLFSYTNLPFAVPGDFAPSPGVLYGGNVSGYAPQVGTLSGISSSADGVQTAGRAQALPGSGSGTGVAAPVLIAVLALAGVTAALVRTWVLRRVAAI
ncbi:hypothetical protein [Kutzneria kofuensis]|uniref:Uncharacterized protein n=1 Tax=Kutzneria kofuensis TaxID=103725 RepID=A0A7W9KHJ6_9PSEU|nr:hypothetical protein [Kutzneria kofuensis]MBB5892708.1 hypothetical protein [Kutzneria kofuensis]